MYARALDEAVGVSALTDRGDRKTSSPCEMILIGESSKCISFRMVYLSLKKYFF